MRLDKVFGRATMKTKHIMLAGGAGLLVIGWLIFGRGVDNKSAQAAPPVPVMSGQVVARDVSLNLTGIGTVQAYNTVTIRARVDGELVNVAFVEGSDVRKGDVLAQIDPRPFQAALDNALATLAKDQAALSNAKRDLVRYQDTAGKGYSSRQQFDTQAMTVDSAAAQIQADNATIENARVQLGYTTITSPLDGVTGIRLIDQGNIIHATDTTGLVVVTQLQPISVIFTLPQAELPQITAARAKGTLRLVALDGDGVTELDQGTLSLVDNQIDPTTGTIKLKARFPNDWRTLWPGQFVNVRLQVGAVHDGLTVASRVIQRGPKGFFAFVIKPDNTVEMRPVETGQNDRGQILVTKGLNAGERVVVDGQLRLQPGTLVQATEDKTASAETDPASQSR
jgi:membrane fusion protein, multidrug efflux system